MWFTSKGSARVEGVTIIYQTPDVNGDNQVRVDDVFAVALAFGSNCGDPEYEERLDVILNGKIRVDDVLKVAMYFGTDIE